MSSFLEEDGDDAFGSLSIPKRVCLVTCQKSESVSGSD